MIKKKKIAATFVILFLYVISFLFNTVAGGYWLTPETGGSHKWSFGLSMPTLILWQPYFGYDAPNNTSIAGYIYLPLIALDRRLWHPTMDLINDEQEIFEKINFHTIKVHPRFQERPPSPEIQRRRSEERRVGKECRS